jgi:hypothetical protein
MSPKEEGGWGRVRNNLIKIYINFCDKNIGDNLSNFSTG